MRTKEWLVVFGLLVLVAFSSLVWPARLADDRCWWREKYSLGGFNLTYAVNCDSAEFVRLVIKFPEGYRQNPLRMNRPLYPALAAPVYRLIDLGLRVPAEIEDRISAKLATVAIKEVWVGITPQQVASAWLACILINFFLALSAVYFLTRAGQVIGWGKLSLPLAFLGVFSGRLKDYLLLPHTLMFDFLLPAYVFFLSSRSLKKRIGPSFTELLVLGLLFLGKPLLGALPVVVWLLWRKRDYSVAKLAAPVLPGGCYLGCLWFSGLPFYNHELVAYREGVWWLEVWREAGLGAMAGAIGKQALKVLGYFLATMKGELFLLLGLAASRPRSFLKQVKQSDWQFTGVYFLSWLGFLILVGYLEPPLTYTLFPVWLVFWARALEAFPLGFRWWLLGAALLIKGAFIYQWS